MQLFGTSGIRRLFDQDLLQLALKVGLAVGTSYDNVIIGRDTRTSGSALSHSVMAGILAAGARCSDAGILPTPTLAFTTREFKAGVMITASHNPPEYNGIKLLNPDGSAFSFAQQNKIEDFVAKTAAVDLKWDKIRSSKLYRVAIKKHVIRILGDFPQSLNVKVVVDCGCGAANHISPYLLTKMGCEVIPINCYPSGIFPRDAEPIEANLSELMRTVKETGATLGIAHDGDADRMMAVDESGRFISGDKLLAILAQESGAKQIVTTVDASMSIEKTNLKIRRTKVGDPYVSEELKTWGQFGGEPSGAWVFPQISLCPDGIYAAAQITAIARRHKLSKLVDSIPGYPVIRGNIAWVKPDLAVLKQKLLAAMNPVSFETVDGIKLNFRDGWLLIRPSGTEPKIRLTAEAKSEAIARQYYEKGSLIIREGQQR
jgi:phosphoglucosamine mutase